MGKHPRPKKCTTHRCNSLKKKRTHPPTHLMHVFCTTATSHLQSITSELGVCILRTHPRLPATMPLHKKGTGLCNKRNSMRHTNGSVVHHSRHANAIWVPWISTQVHRLYRPRDCCCTVHTAHSARICMLTRAKLVDGSKPNHCTVVYAQTRSRNVMQQC